MDQGDRVGELGEERGLLDGGVAAADHGDVVVAEEEAVAGGAGGDAVADEFASRWGGSSMSDWAPVDTITDWAR